MLKQIIRYTNADTIEATWVMTPEGGRPFPGQWLDPNDVSAIEANYWCKGQHPRPKKSRKLWHQRNAGEHCSMVCSSFIIRNQKEQRK